jgi:hypothetical protein
MSWRQFLAFCKIINPLRSEGTQNETGNFAQQAVAQSVDPFKMLKQQDQFLDMIGSQTTIFVVERMGHCVADPIVA